MRQREVLSQYNCRRDPAKRTRTNKRAARVAVVLMAVPFMHCAGPQPLDVAINMVDERAYVEHLNDANLDARRAYLEWMAAERDESTEILLAADKAVSTKRNPFDAYTDPQAVSRGAVIFKMHCARCHGQDARGNGPSALPDHPAKNFHSFGKRLTSTLHRGAPRKWFRIISEGTGDVVEYPDGASKAMPAFGEIMTREQIWLAITYLQSLDMHAR